MTTDDGSTRFALWKHLHSTKPKAHNFQAGPMSPVGNYQVKVVSKGNYPEVSTGWSGRNYGFGDDRFGTCARNPWLPNDGDENKMLRKWLIWDQTIEIGSTHLEFTNHPLRGAERMHRFHLWWRHKMSAGLRHLVLSRNVAMVNIKWEGRNT